MPMIVRATLYLFPKSTHHSPTLYKLPTKSPVSSRKSARSLVSSTPKPTHLCAQHQSYVMSCYGGYFDHDMPHFLEACFLCRKPLGRNSDIFMYRGNTPFCSKECRQEQIDFDEANEKKSWKMSSSSSRSLQKSDADESSTNKTVQSGTVAVA
ncbi:hypothetical protein K2173_024975 [Erythroxylum novogranatense]|uniref:FLZ-type domain-containing protein n=1 Tax=Erythroxylum novogranatense TaxID=1862640 RepID=A0AAV8UD06_9ROSI|nr:hypothetical protein K2173_024975 [Erythroxylum novogranatense]